MSLPFLSTPPSCPCHFSVCPLHFPCMSRSFVASHFPTSPVVPIGFLVLCFPFIPPALALFCLFHVSFSSPLFPFIVDFLFLPLISLHPVPQKTVFPAFSQRGRPEKQIEVSVVVFWGAWLGKRKGRHIFGACSWGPTKRSRFFPPCNRTPCFKKRPFHG